jgi:hypothetical protein
MRLTLKRHYPTGTETGVRSGEAVSGDVTAVAVGHCQKPRPGVRKEVDIRHTNTGRRRIQRKQAAATNPDMPYAAKAQHHTSLGYIGPPKCCNSWEDRKK